jgi:predicted nucleic acid-binding protein
MAIVFDSSAVIAYKPKVLPSSTIWSAVVIQELMAGARDTSELRAWEATAREYDRNQRLLVPTGEDWLQAGRILNLLLRGMKSKSAGRTPKLHPQDKQRIIRDVLIARTVRRVNGLLITDNMEDFRQIRKFCNVRVQSGGQFFGS